MDMIERATFSVAIQILDNAAVGAMLTRHRDDGPLIRRERAQPGAPQIFVR
jgi:hypothetical protein